MRVKLGKIGPSIRYLGLILVCTAAAGLAGCGKKEQGAASQGQVVARIGDATVTTQELENEFRLANIPPDRQKEPAVIKQVLNELVLRKYLAEQAINTKLDREPSILLDILRSRDVVLATAFIAHSVNAKPITQSDIDKYISSNPQKFANRQLIAVTEVVFPFGPTTQSAMDSLKDVKSLDEVDQKLASMDIVHTKSTATLSTTELSEELANLIQAKKDTDVFFVRSGPNGVFFKVTGETLQPITGEAATNLARQLIRSDRVKAETSAAAVSAHLDAKYEGNYKTIMQGQNEIPAPKQ